MTILYLYITIFTIYYVILALISLKSERKIRDKYTSKDSNMCVIVYASGEAGYLENLVKQLKSQNYPKERYSIYVILDKVENPPEFIFQTDLEINVVNINNMEPIGKSQAYSIMAEKLSEAPNLDAYVFMETNNCVDADFLSNVNFYLTKHKVFMPTVSYIGEYSELSFWDCVRVTYFRYISRFIYSSRTRLGLTNLIDTDAFVIRRDILNKIGSFDFRNKTSEVNYSLKLANEGLQVAQVSDVKVFRNINKYDSRIPSLSKRIGIFWNNFSKCRTFIGFEYITSLLVPNWLACLLIYAMLLGHSYYFPFVVSFSTILISAIILILAFCVSLFNANIYAKEYLFLFAYPLYSIAHIVYNFPPIRFVRNFVNNKNRKHSIEKMITDVIVTDGKNDYACKIELISDDGLARVKFINKNKTYTTKNNHLRMVDAMKELSQKLEDYSLSLKVCQRCRYFQPVIDGSTNMVMGCCNCKFEGRVEGDMIQTLIWNTCPYFEKQNVVNLF